MSQSYQALVEDRIFMGAASDIEAIEKIEQIDVIIDLRGEATECAYPDTKAKWLQIPIGDSSPDNQILLYKQAIDEVVSAYRSGRKVAFHCGGGKGRTGTVAVGTLMALVLAETVAQAEEQAKSIRMVIELKPQQREILEQLFH